jgi:hypothetical protein
MGRELTPDQRADRLASRQHGAISGSQALKTGLTRRQIERRLASGRWLPVARSVYVTASSSDTLQRRCMVACLAGPPGTVASHLTAAALFGLSAAPPVPHLTVPRGSSGRQREAVVHFGSLVKRDTCKVGPIPTTTPARTLVDCAGILDYEPLCNLVDSALYRKLADPALIEQAVTRACRAPGRKGTRLLGDALSVWVSGVRPGSPAEARVLRCLARWGLPAPERQFIIRDAMGRFVARVDFAWPWRRGLMEYDGERYHGPRGWQPDAKREARLEALGWTIVRADRFDLGPSATRLRDELRRLLGVEQAA